MPASTSRSRACSRKAWSCTRPTERKNGEWVDAGRSQDRGRRATRARATLARDRRADRDRPASRRCRSRRRTPSTPTTSSATYGADAARWFMLSDSPPERDVDLDRGGRAGRLALRATAVAAGRRGRRDRQGAPAARPADFSERRLRSQGRPSARSPRSPTISRSCVSTSASRISTNSPMRCGDAIGQSRKRAGARLRLGLAGSRPTSWCGCSIR